MSNHAAGLADIYHDTNRQMLGNHSCTSAGFLLNNTTGQTTTVTLDGTIHTGDVLTVTLGGVAYAFTVTGTEDTLAKAATALAAVIDAAAAYTASATGAVITVVAANVDVPYTVAVAVTGTGATTTLASAITIPAGNYLASANTLKYVVGGVPHSVAAIVGATAAAIGGAVLPVSSFRWYTVSIGAAETMVVTVGTDNIAGMPPGPAGNAVCGAFKVVTDSTHTFTPGTTALNSAGITTTFFNLSVVPSAGYPV